MAQPASRVLGLSEVLADLGKIKRASGDLEAFGVIAGDVSEEAAGRVHVRSGLLRDRIVPAATANSAVVVAGTDYAGVVNYARPGDGFLTGPANENVEDREQQISDNLDRLIRRYGMSR